jgi:hypothetical protein
MKQPRLHNIHARNISDEIDDNMVEISAKSNKIPLIQKIFSKNILH